MDKTEKMEKLNKAKSKQINELEKKIKELENENRNLTRDYNFEKKILKEAHEVILELNGKNEALIMALRIITGNERYNEPEIELPKQSEEDFD